MHPSHLASGPSPQLQEGGLCTRHGFMVSGTVGGPLTQESALVVAVLASCPDEAVKRARGLRGDFSPNGCLSEQTIRDQLSALASLRRPSDAPGLSGWVVGGVCITDDGIKKAVEIPICALSAEDALLRASRVPGFTPFGMVPEHLLAAYKAEIDDLHGRHSPSPAN